VWQIRGECCEDHSPDLELQSIPVGEQFSPFSHSESPGKPIGVYYVRDSAANKYRQHEHARGGRHLAFLPRAQALEFLRGEIQHKNLWLMDLEAGTERQLTNLTSGFDIRDFDISPDGREVVPQTSARALGCGAAKLDLPQR
jgi:hypothetical protein